MPLDNNSNSNGNNNHNNKNNHDNNNNINDNQNIKPCCACPDTRKARDECILMHGED
jgi:hypothetical protein